MRGRDLVIPVLDQMEMLDQEIAAPRPVAEQQLDLVRGGRIDLAAFWRRLGPPPAFAGVIERANFLHIMDHGKTSRSCFSADLSLVCGMPDAKTIIAFR